MHELFFVDWIYNDIGLKMIHKKSPRKKNNCETSRQNQLISFAGESTISILTCFHLASPRSGKQSKRR